MKKGFKRLIVIVAMCVLGMIVGSVFCFFSRASEVKDSNIVTENTDKSYEKKINKKIKKVIKYFHNEEYDKIIKMFSDDAKETLTVNLLKEIRETRFYKEYFVRIKNVHITEEENLYIVNVTIEEKHRYHCVVFYLDKKYNMMGIYSGDTIPIPEQSEYFTEEAIKVGSLEEYPLDGLLTLPKNVDKAPVVILVHGSGFHDADESFGSNRMFAQIAHGLAKKGIATIRYNERFNQYSWLLSSDKDEDGIPDMKYTVYTEAIDDAVSIVDQISKDSRIDSNNIYIVGHSLGGMVAPKIAELNSKVKGIISLAGSPRSLIDIGDDQGTLKIQDMENITEYEKLTMWYQTLEYNDSVRYLEEDGAEKMGMYTKDYWLSTNNLNVEESLNKLDIPMLILQGEDDLQVYADKDYTEWQRILQGRDNCEFKLYDGLNHMFTKSLGYNLTNINNEYIVPASVDERVIQDIGEFVNKYSR